MSEAADLGFDARLARPENRAMATVLKNLGVFGLGAFGVGAGIRGAQGLGELVAGTTGAPPKVPIRRQFIDVPIARRKSREEEGPLRALAKQAEQAVPLPRPDWGTRAAGRVLDLFGAFKQKIDPVAGGLVNPLAREWHQHPWALPTGMVLGVGGLMGGHALTDAVIGKAKANEDDSELEQAKRRYEQALGGKLAAASPRCAGCDREFAPEEAKCPTCGMAKEAAADGLDRAWDLLEKAATFWDDAAWPIAAVGTGLGGIGLASGMAAYNYTRDHAPDKAVERALKERRERLFAAGPPAIVAVPREREEQDAPGIDLAAIRRKIDAYRAPKAAGLPPAQAGNAAISQLHGQAEQARARARAALGIEEEVPKPAPAVEAPPHRPPSVAQGLVKAARRIPPPPVTAEQKDMAARGHGIQVGSCGHVVGSCRCREGHTFSVRVDRLCRDCETTT